MQFVLSVKKKHNKVRHFWPRMQTNENNPEGKNLYLCCIDLSSRLIRCGQGQRSLGTINSLFLRKILEIFDCRNSFGYRFLSSFG